MEEEKFACCCKETVQYILDNKRITEKECVAKFGYYYGNMVFNELIKLKVGNQVGYGPLEKNNDTQSFLGYFDKKVESIRQKERDSLLDRQFKMINIKYTKRAYIISIIAIFLSTVSIIISLKY